MRPRLSPFILALVVALIIILIFPVSASIFTIDDAQAAISIKTISDIGVVGKDAVDEKDLKTDILQTVQLQLSKVSKSTETKYVQLYPESSVFISTDFDGTTNIMQTSTKEGFPLVETRYRCQKSWFEPWQYYFRIEKVDKDNAYVVYAEYASKSVWLGTIPRSTYDKIISDGKIPEWGTF